MRKALIALKKVALWPLTKNATEFKWQMFTNPKMKKETCQLGKAVPD